MKTALVIIIKSVNVQVTTNVLLHSFHEKSFLLFTKVYIRTWDFKETTQKTSAAEWINRLIRSKEASWLGAARHRWKLCGKLCRDL